MQVAEDPSGHVSILQKRDAGKSAPISITVGIRRGQRSLSASKWERLCRSRLPIAKSD
jgi:hypothetical protein